MNDTLITDAKTLSGDAVDVLISNGRIDDVTPAGELAGTFDDEYDAGGRLVAPSFTEPHTHLDMALVAGEPRWNETGTLTDGIRLWREYKATLSADGIRARATRALEWFAANGVTRVRTHADTTDETLVGVETLLELKREVEDVLDLQVVAFPQDGLLTAPHHEDLLCEALEMGADLVGGIPHFEATDGDGVAATKLSIELAEKHDCAVDLHIDEVDDPGSRFTEVLANETRNRGLGGRVTASHATALHSYPNDYADRVVSMLAESDVAVVTNPLDNSVLQGRYDDYPRRRGHTRIDELHDAGVTVGLGHDSVMDPVYHYGCADPLDAAFVLVHYAHMNGYDDVDTIWRMLTDANAAVFGADDYGLAPGDEGSLVVFDGETPFDVLRTRASRRLVLSSGRVLSRTDPAETTVRLLDTETSVDLGQR